MSDEKPVMLDAAEVAEIIGKTENWVMTQARARKIIYTQVGRHKRWTPGQVDEIIRSWERKPQPVTVARAAPRGRVTRAASGAGQSSSSSRRGAA